MNARIGIAAGVAFASLMVTAGCSRNHDVSYVAEVAPIFDQRCAECHNPGGEGAAKSGFVTASYDTVMAGTRLGAVVVPGSSASSTLFRMVSGKVDASIRMPHQREPLDEEQVETIKLWIDQGARNG